MFAGLSLTSEAGEVATTTLTTAAAAASKQWLNHYM